MSKFKVGDKIRFGKYKGVVVEINSGISKYSNLVRLEGFNGHKGNHYTISGENYKTNDHWYVSDNGLELIKHVKTEPIVIYRKDNYVIALDKNTGKRGVAKCNPSDKFDFQTGAKLAFERLMNSEEKLLQIWMGTALYGVIGEATPYKDILNRPLFVGDEVEIYDKSGNKMGSNLVVKSKTAYTHYEKYFIMGIESRCNDKTSEIEHDWKVLKIKDHKDLKAGDIFKGLKVKA